MNLYKTEGINEILSPSVNCLLEVVKSGGLYEMATINEPQILAIYKDI